MRYFMQEDFDKCMKFLADKPDTVETQQELYKFMHDECHMLFDWRPITVKSMEVYSRVYETRFNPGTANWCVTMNDGSQVIWNKKYQEFYMINEVGIDHCDRLKYIDMFPDIMNIDKWLLDKWPNWRFRETQKQLIAIWNGKYDENFKNYWRK